MSDGLSMPPYERFDLNSIKQLASQIGAAKRDQSDATWPSRQLQIMADAGVYRWFIPRSQGGWGWTAAELTDAYIELSAACLSSTFVLTQRVAALKRIALSPNASLRDTLLPGLLNGQLVSTVGISHLTTSRQHVSRPVMGFEIEGGDFVLNGFCPWVTGANDVSHVVVGAQGANEQILAAVPANSAGLTVDPGFQMIALTDTHTGAIRFDNVRVSADELLAGPNENVLSSLSAVSTGSYQTSALALGVAQAAIDYLQTEAQQRADVSSSAASLRAQHDQLRESLLQVAGGNPVCSNEQIRTEANQLVLRATQAAMVAAKGAGFVTTHPVGRWCQEALFFLVWSCPQAVRDANLCELAGVRVD